MTKTIPKNLEYRKNAVKRLGQLLLERKTVLAQKITEEMGKLLRDSTAEIEKCADSCQFFLQMTDEALGPTPIESKLPGRVWVERAPMGKILALMPWNFPFWQVIRSAVPALLAGNSYHIKHSKITPRCAEELERLFHDAGFAAEEYENLVIPEEEIAERVQELIARPDIRAVTFTGSTQVGRKIASECAKHLKKSVLELGGSDPWIVCDSAKDRLDSAVDAFLNARLLANGQSCISPKRLLVAASVAETFKTMLIEKMRAVKIGDPWDSETHLGPLSSIAAVENLEGLLKDAGQNGARIFYQGSLPAVLGDRISEIGRSRNQNSQRSQFTGASNTENSGDLNCETRVFSREQYFPLTAVENITEKARLFHEEAFGPLISFYVYSDAAEAVKLANFTEYGLGAAVWSSSEEEKNYFQHHLCAGNIYFNSPVFSNAFLPFGGVKSSGWGKEMGIQGMREFTHEKTCYSV